MPDPKADPKALTEKVCGYGEKIFTPPCGQKWFLSQEKMVSSEISPHGSAYGG